MIEQDAEFIRLYELHQAELGIRAVDFESVEVKLPVWPRGRTTAVLLYGKAAGADKTRTDEFAFRSVVRLRGRPEPGKGTCPMDRMSELRRLGVVEAYLTDLICDVKDPRHADILMQALNGVQQELMRLEGKFVAAAAKASVASL